jgi:hypothetical protein
MQSFLEKSEFQKTERSVGAASLVFRKWQVGQGQPCHKSRNAHNEAEKTETAAS